MNYVVNISFDEEARKRDGVISFLDGIDPLSCSFCFNLRKEENIIDVLKDNGNLKRMFFDIEMRSKIFGENKYSELMKDLKSQIENNEFFDSVNYVYLSGNRSSIVEFIENNKFLKDKVLVYNENMPLDIEWFNKLKESFGNLDIKVKVSGNDDLVTIDEYGETIVAIDEIVSKVKRYDYSPFEALMYAYDLIRDRFYIKEDDTEKYSSSRDLTSVLFGDKIVCVGFANIFNAVVKKLGVNSSMFYLLETTGKSGHARNLIYLKDEKYEIDGLYFFDPTFDCKKDNDNDFLSSYRFFAKTKKEIDSLTSYDFYYQTYSLFDLEDIFKYEDDVVASDFDGYKGARLINDTKVNKMLKLMNREELIIYKRHTKDDLIDKLYFVNEMANKPILIEKFIKALYVVRKNQYYERPNKYLFDIKALTDILLNSKFTTVDDGVDRLMYAILGVSKKVNENIVEDKIQKCIISEGLDLDMERVKLTRLLREISNKKIEDERKLNKKM